MVRNDEVEGAVQRGRKARFERTPSVFRPPNALVSSVVQAAPVQVDPRCDPTRPVSTVHPIRSAPQRIQLSLWKIRYRIMRAVVAEEGMSTAEYAIGTIAAAAFGAVLYGVVTGDSIVDALTKIIERALDTAV